MTDVSALIEKAYRETSGRIRASLLRTLRDFELAEEVVHEAFAAALVQWPVEGTPVDPAAWLMRTARNKAIDVVRHRAGAAAKLVAIAAETDPSYLQGDVSPLEDDMLRLIFTCCHPAIAIEERVALTLQTVCGIRTEEIARAFLLPVPTMAQRLVRAKRKIRDAGIPYDVPDAPALAARVSAVCSVVYLVFNEGYAATEGPALVRSDLCVEAIRLGRLLDALMPERSNVEGLLALLLLIDARRSTRLDAEGIPVLLEEQDRSAWDHDQIREGQELLRRALERGPTTSFGVQAAIAAIHAGAATSADTDWAQIVLLYDVLLGLQPSPVVSLNRATAVAMSQGFAAGLELLDALEAEGELADYHLFHAARADLMRRLGRRNEAGRAYARALELVGNDPERRFLQRRLAALTGN